MRFPVGPRALLKYSRLLNSRDDYRNPEAFGEAHPTKIIKYVKKFSDTKQEGTK